MVAPIERTRKFIGSFDALVHVGANDGSEIEDYVASGVKSAILIEPVPAIFERLAERCAAVGYQCVQAVCTERDGEPVTLHLASNDAQSTSVLRPTGHLSVHRSISFDTTVPMNGTTLDSLLANIEQIDGRLMLVVDVQGFELAVLRGAEDTLSRTDAAWLELSHVDLYQGNALFTEVVQFMDEKGFKLVHLKMNHKMYGDGLFVRSK